MLAPTIINTYRTRHFGLQELVAPEIYKERGERAWELLDPQALYTLDCLRDEFGPLTVNDYEWGGKYKYSGMRPMGAGHASAGGVAIGAKWSAHKFGIGFDVKPKLVTVQEMYAEILKRAAAKFPYLRVLENIKATPTWIHFDCRNHTKSGIWIVNP